MSQSLGSSLPLLRAAQVDYFRIPRYRWPLILLQLHRMEAEVVLTSGYWGWHEADDNQFDLTGQSDPRRDLVGFVHLCAEAGFKTILQLDPTLCAGVLGNGVPVWFLNQHHQALALRSDGTPRPADKTGQPYPSSTHPLFLEYVRRWYQKVTEALLPLQSPGGPIVGIQINGYHVHDDRNPHVTGTLWPVRLRKQYKTIAALNEAHGTAYISFGQVPLSAYEHLPDLEQFADWCTAHSLSVYLEMLRTAGWHVPIYHRTSWPTHLPIPGFGLQADDSSSTRAWVISPAVRTDPDPPDVGAFICWGQGAPIQADGTANLLFWKIKTWFHHLTFGGRLVGQHAAEYESVEQSLLYSNCKRADLPLSSAVFEGNLGAIAAMDDAFLLCATGTGVFSLSRPAGWSSMTAWRLQLDGNLVAQPFRLQGDTLQVAHSTQLGEEGTDLTLLLPTGSNVPTGVQQYLEKLLACRRAMLHEGLYGVEELLKHLQDIQVWAETAAAPNAAGHGGHSALAQAVDSLDKASRYAASMRTALEGHAARPLLLPETRLIKMTQEALAHLIALGEAVKQARPGLVNVIEQLGLPGETWTLDAYLLKLAQLSAIATSTSWPLAQGLCTVRADLQAHHIEPEFGRRVEQALTHLLYILSDLGNLSSNAQAGQPAAEALS